MTNSEKLLQRIKDDQLQPIPKWKFQLKQWSVWFMFALSIILGALSFSVILFTIQQTEFDLLSHITHSTSEFILAILPFFWLIGLLVFLVIAMYSIQYSKKAYKFTLSKLTLLSVGLSIVLGTMYFIGGGADQLEKTFANNVGIYTGLENKKKEMWTMPEEGYLSGTISYINNDTIQLIDFKQNTWIIITKNAFIAPRINLVKDEKIKLTGKVINKNTFGAAEVLPWGRRGRH